MALSQPSIKQYTCLNPQLPNLPYLCVSAGSEAGGGGKPGKGGNDQAITYPPRGVCLREALSVLHEAVNLHKTVEQPRGLGRRSRAAGG